MHDSSLSITAEKVQKRFGKNFLFRNINLSVKKGDSFFITGPNGSGKSTLLQILAGIQKPTSGNIVYTSDKTIIEKENYKEFFGFTGPQVNPYDMLTSIENLKFTGSASAGEDLIKSYLERFDLYRHRTKPVKYYSSGMKQRLRLIHALINDPEILMLDEPCTNLDARGRDILYKLIDEIKFNKILIIATNESDDMNLCSKGISLEQQGL
jgi:ABC-type multidrug transport system ATPase subunit